MNFCEICVIGLCFAVLENAVTGNYCENYPSKLPPFKPPLYFGYMSLDPDYNMVLKLKNVSRKITAVLVAVHTDDPVLKNEYKWVRYNSKGNEFRICGNMKNSRVTIVLELSSSNGVCARILVSEGKHVMTLPDRLADSKYLPNIICLHKPNESCAIEMDLRHFCNESEPYPYADPRKSYVVPKPTNQTYTSHKPKRTTPRQTQSLSGTKQRKSKTTPLTLEPAHNNPDTSRHAFITPKPVISYTVQNISIKLKSTHHISEDHKKSIWDSQQETRNITVTTNVTRVTLDTSNAVDFRADVADIKKYVTITCSAVSVMMLILIVHVTRKCCWIKRNPFGSSQLLTNDVGDGPFYLNMLFRKECDREIEQIEQHHYEEINLQ